jgi:integrase
MAGDTNETPLTKLNTPKARAGLKPGSYWRALDVTKGKARRAHLGYRRKPRKEEGRWVLRSYLGHRRYQTQLLGKADDARDADGEGVLSFDQAQELARNLLGAAPARQERMTVREAMARYTAFKVAQGQPTRDLIIRTEAHILPALGDVVVAELTAKQIREWVATLASQPAMVRPKKDGKVQWRREPTSDDDVRRRRSSANRVLTMLKAGLNHAYDEGHVSSNTEWGRRVKPFENVDAARARYLKVAEAKRLINACDPEFRPLVQAALQTGARYGELAALEVGDYNPDSGTVTVRKSKTGKTRHVVLTDEGQSLFAQVTAGRATSERIFRHADGTPWGKSDQGRPMKAACERAKISPPLGIHGLRHTWASLAVMAGVPLMIVAKNLGHTDTRMVEKHYGHHAPSFVADAIRAGAPRFGFKPDKKIATLVPKGR